MERLRGTVAHIGPGPPIGGMGGSQAAVGAHGGPAGHGTSQRPGPTSWGDGESYPRGVRCLWRACRGRHVPNGPGPPAGGTGSPAQVAVGAYGGRAGDGSSQRPGPTSWGDRESCQGGGRCLWRACSTEPGALRMGEPDTETGGRGRAGRVSATATSRAGPLVPPG